MFSTLPDVLIVAVEVSIIQMYIESDEYKFYHCFAFVQLKSYHWFTK